MGTDAEIMGPVGQLHIDDGGSGGLPVVFIHSFGGSTAHWTEQLQHVRGSRRAVAFDLPGHGRTDARVDEDVTIEDLADDLGTVLDGLKLGRVALVGHSIGGLIAIAYGASHPDRVAGMLLAGTPGRVPLQQADQVMSAMSSNYEDTMNGYWERLLADATPKVREQINAEREQLPEDVATTLIKSTFAYDPLPGLRDYPGVVQLVTIGDSPFDLHEQLPELPNESVTGTSHWFQLDRPEAFDQLLDAFMARVDAAEAGSAAWSDPAAMPAMR